MTFVDPLGSLNNIMILLRQHQDVVEATQRIHDSHVSLLYEREHQTDDELMTIYCNHRVLQEA